MIVGNQIFLKVKRSSNPFQNTTVSPGQKKIAIMLKENLVG